MWHVKYTGPHQGVSDETDCDTWKAAHERIVVMIKTVAPFGTYATLIVSANEAKPGVEWSATDAVHTFSISQAAPTIGDAIDMMDDTGLDAETVCALLLDESLPTPAAPDNVVCLFALTGAFDECSWPSCGCLTEDKPTPAHIGSGITHCPPAVVTVLPDVDHTTRPHAELGASSSERWMNCPASVRLIRGIPNLDTAYSKRGTAAHEVAHMCLLSGQDAVEFIGRTVNDIEIDETIAEGVQVYLDNCRAHSVTEKHYEVRFNLESLKPPSPMYGTSDFVGYDALTQTLYVDDYKNGFVYVDPRTPQLRYYALGALIWLGNEKPVSQITVTICQPNALGAALKTDTFDAIELVEWSRELIAAAHRTIEPDAPAVAGKWCAKPGANCPVAGKCVVHAAHKLEAAQVQFADYLAPMRTPEVRLLSAAERGAIHGAAEGLKAFLSAVEDSIKADAAGTGWKLVPTETRQAWLDKDEAAMSLRMDHGIDPYEPAEVISPAVARGKLKESLRVQRVAQHATGKKPTKKAAEADARVLLADLITDISSGTKLVPEADSRPAIPTGGAEFDNLKV